MDSPLSGKETLIKKVPGDIYLESVSPDGSHIIYKDKGTYWKSASYISIDRDGTPSKILPCEFFSSYEFDWAPDGHCLYILNNKYIKRRNIVTLEKTEF